MEEQSVPSAFRFAKLIDTKIASSTTFFCFSSSNDYINNYTKDFAEPKENEMEQISLLFSAFRYTESIVSSTIISNTLCSVVEFANPKGNEKDETTRPLEEQKKKKKKKVNLSIRTCRPLATSSLKDQRNTMPDRSVSSNRLPVPVSMSPRSQWKAGRLPRRLNQVHTGSGIFSG